MFEPAPISNPSVVSNRDQSCFQKIAGWESVSVQAKKPVASPPELDHRDLKSGEFWRSVPAFSEIDFETFSNHSWQMRQSVTTVKKLRQTIGDLVPDSFYQDVELGLKRAPMPLRLSPYLLSVIDWQNPETCPVRTQFIPMGKSFVLDHPMLDLDSLHEQEDSPTPGLTHRYFDKILFLPLDSCPVYCRFCTRSYAIGLDTESVSKVSFGIDYERWKNAFAYIASRPEIEDVVISGGDAFNLRPQHIEAIGITLLKMPHIRRIRFATKGLAILPLKIISHDEWVDALTHVVDFGRDLHKEVVVHTHFNHPNEITWLTRMATSKLFERGITVRNQSVLQRKVNDNVQDQIRLARRLSYVNVQPYYVYLCDMVKGVEDLRTSVADSVRLEKYVRGSTAGFNTPRFICDAPEGGGKRSIHSYEYYNKETGIAVYAAPTVKKDRLFMYFDPLHSLSLDIQSDWHNPDLRRAMIEDARDEALKLSDL